MVPWFLREPTRLRKERECISQLSQSCEWLVGHEWCFDGRELCLDAVIRAHNFDYEVRVLFPPLFPDAPVVVRPLNASTRWTTHQYGEVDGPLCLEWGPDNWTREVTASEMLKSTYRLLEIENPLGIPNTDSTSIAPSRHKLTPGQELRGSMTRWYFSASLNSFFSNQAKYSAGSFSFSLRQVGEDEFVILVHKAARMDETTWLDPLVPTNFPGLKAFDMYPGVWFQTDIAREEIARANTLTQICQLLPNSIDLSILATDGSSPIEGMNRGLVGVIILDAEKMPHAFIVTSSGSAINCARLESESDALLARMPDFERLADKRVGIVGVGSIGSKVATTLCRMGVQAFYLVDHDVFLPENIARNALDWQSVARHKVDAAKTALLLISPTTRVEVAQIHLTGQESNAVINRVLAKLTDCDVIVDATANSGVFNLLAAVSRIAQRHLVWVEVFGGGVGGLLARSRAGLDPSPQHMRLIYLRYCEQNPAPASLRKARDYEMEGPDREVAVASDAEASILAGHSALLVSDCFRSGTESKYPYSMYLLGLAAGWVFTQPLETIPIDTGNQPEPFREVGDTDLLPEDVHFLTELVSKASS